MNQTISSRGFYCYQVVINYKKLADLKMVHPRDVNEAIENTINLLSRYEDRRNILKIDEINFTHKEAFSIHEINIYFLEKNEQSEAIINSLLHYCVSPCDKSNLYGNQINPDNYDSIFNNFILNFNLDKNLIEKNTIECINKL